MGDGFGEAGTKGDAEESSQPPHYLGHRERLRARFMEAGADALPDYELLELLLARTIPRRDTKPLAKELLARFGSFADVLAASPERLKAVKGLGGGQAIIDLKLVHAAGVRMLRRQVLNRPALTSWSTLLDYCTAAMACSETEQFRILLAISHSIDNSNTYPDVPKNVPKLCSRPVSAAAVRRRDGSARGSSGCTWHWSGGLGGPPPSSCRIA